MCCSLCCIFPPPGRPISPSRKRHIATHQHLLSVSSVDEGTPALSSALIEMDIHERLADLHIDNDMVYDAIRAAVQTSSGRYIEMLVEKICSAAMEAHLITQEQMLTPHDVEELSDLFPPPMSPSCRTVANNVAAKALHHIRNMQLQHIELDTSHQLVQALTLLCLEPDQHLTTTATSLPSEAVTYILSHSAWDQQQLRSILTSTSSSAAAARVAHASPLALNMTSQTSYMTESPHSAHYSIHMIDDGDMSSHMVEAPLPLSAMSSHMEAPLPLSAMSHHAPKKSVTIMPLHHVMDEHYQIYEDEDAVDGRETARVKRAHEIKQLTEAIQVSTG